MYYKQTKMYNYIHVCICNIKHTFMAHDSLYKPKSSNRFRVSGALPISSVYIVWTFAAYVQFY